jgi:TrmH family RNA methyltransferase
VVIEGPNLLSAAIASGIKPVAVFGTRQGLTRHKAPGVELSESVFKAIADAETPQGIAAEIPLPSVRREGTWVFLEGVQDAGNVGAIIRSAAAFGAGAVILDRACADPWSPKVLRAGAGGHFALQITQVDELAPLVEGFAGEVLCTVPRGGKAIGEFKNRVGWVFGSEGGGVSAALQALAAAKVTIPMTGTESLNVAAAAAICLYFSRPGAGS